MSGKSFVLQPVTGLLYTVPKLKKRGLNHEPKRMMCQDKCHPLPENAEVMGCSGAGCKVATGSQRHHMVIILP